MNNKLYSLNYYKNKYVIYSYIPVFTKILTRKLKKLKMENKLKTDIYIYAISNI